MWMRYVSLKMCVCVCFISSCSCGYGSMKTESCYTHDESCHTFERPISHISTSHGVRVNESYHTGGWVMSHIWTRHVTRIHGPCHTYGWVMSNIWMSHLYLYHVAHRWLYPRDITYMNWVMSRIWMTHPYVCMKWPNKIYIMTMKWVMPHRYEWDMSHIWIGLFAYQWLRPRTRSLEHRDATVPSCVLQWFAVCCRVLSVCCSVLCLRTRSREHCATTVPSCVLQCFAMCWVCVAAYWVRAATCCSAHCNCTFLCVAVYCSVCVAVCCSVLSVL